MRLRIRVRSGTEPVACIGSLRGFDFLRLNYEENRHAAHFTF